jgi:hypothetical protein
MTRPTDFHPVILFEGDLKPIYHALLAAGRKDLAALIEEKTARSESDRCYIAAAPTLDDNDFNYDSMPIVSEGDEGAYVSCWVWVSKERATEVADDAVENTMAEETRAKLAAARRRRIIRRIARLKPSDKNALLMLLSETLYGVNLDPHTEWTQSTIEHVADRLDCWLQLRS